MFNSRLPQGRKFTRWQQTRQFALARLI